MIVLFLHYSFTHYFVKLDVANVKSTKSRKEKKVETAPQMEAMILGNMQYQNVTNVFFLKVSAPVETSSMPEALKTFIKGNDGSFVFTSVQWKPGELLCSALERSVVGNVHSDTLVVCHLGSRALGSAELLTGLGSFFVLLSKRVVLHLFVKMTTTKT